MVNHYVMKLEHDLFIVCLPYEWRSGTGDALFLPIYPPRSMRVVLCFDKYVSSLWLMLSPWIIRTLTLPPLLASLVSRKFRRCIKPTIYPSSKQPLRESWTRGCVDSRTIIIGRTPRLWRYKIEDFVPCPDGTFLGVEGKLGDTDM